MEILTVKDSKEIDEVLDFFAEVFSDYVDITDERKETRRIVMQSQFKEDPNFIIYIKDKGLIVAALLAYRYKSNPIVTVSLLGVSKEYRLHKFGSMLLEEIASRAKACNCEKIILQSKTTNYDFYIKNGYIPILRVYLFRDISKEEFEKANKFDFEIYDYESKKYVFEGKDCVDTRIEYIVDYPKDEYLNYYHDQFENSSDYYYLVRKLK